MEYRATTDNNNNNNKIQFSRDWNIHEGKKKTPPPSYLYHAFPWLPLGYEEMEMAIVQA